MVANPQMKCRKATIADARAIALVLLSGYNIKTLSEAIAVFKNERKKGHHYLVAIEEKKITGIVTWLMHGLPKHQLAELDRIAVLPEYRGRGVAQMLFSALIKDAQSHYKGQKSRLRKLYLLTHDDNARAQKFYEKLGFRHETTLKDHYYQGIAERVYSIFF